MIYRVWISARVNEEADEETSFVELNYPSSVNFSNYASISNAIIAMIPVLLGEVVSKIVEKEEMEAEVIEKYLGDDTTVVDVPCCEETEIKGE